MGDRNKNLQSKIPHNTVSNSSVYCAINRHSCITYIFVAFYINKNKLKVVSTVNSEIFVSILFTGIVLKDTFV